MYMRRGASRNIMKIFSLGMTVISLSSACEQRSSLSAWKLWWVDAVVRGSCDAWKHRAPVARSL
jgi:hypothetical protein